MSRRDLTLARKIEILDLVKSQPPNTSQRELAQITGIPKTTLIRLLKGREKLEQEWKDNSCQGTTRKRKREGKDPDIDEKLYEWYEEVTRLGVEVSGVVLKIKANEFAAMLNRPGFKASDGWLSRWKIRHSIKLKKTHKTSEDLEMEEEWRINLQNILGLYNPDSIYNAVETNLFYGATPDQLNTSQSVDRIIVLCCSNMSGKDKRKLLVIGKNANPRCFKSFVSLPVVYRSGPNAMTADIFKDYLLEWDKELQETSKNIILILEKCEAHPLVDNLQNIQIQYLPNSLKEPLDMGVIKNLKHLYREKLNYVVDIKKMNILQAIQFVAYSWTEIQSSTIRKSFENCGFIAQTNQEEIENFEDFIKIEIEESEVQCEDVAVTKVEDVGQELTGVSHREAMNYINELRLYFLQHGNEESHMEALDSCADFVNKKLLEDSS